MKKTFIFIGFVLLAYLAGIFFPIHKSFIPHLVNKDLSVNDLITRLVQSVAALATFTSAFVALFRDELRRKFLEKHDISISFLDKDDKLIEIKMEGEGQTNDTIVKEYICKLEFINVGNVVEKNAEISIQNIKTKHVAERSVKYDIPLYWENNQISTRIPIKGYRHFKLFSLVSPQELEENDDFGTTTSNTIIPPKLKLTNDIEYTTQIKLEITYLISYDNNRHDEFTILLDWNGRWENRILEMKDHITVNLKK